MITVVAFFEDQLQGSPDGQPFLAPARNHLDNSFTGQADSRTISAPHVSW